MAAKLMHLQSALALSFVFWTQACVTSAPPKRKAAPKAAQLPPPIPNPAHKPLLQKECPVQALACTSVHDPVVCTATHYGDQTLPAGLQVMAWGDNPCKGQLALARDACTKALAPSLLTHAQCVPDPSNGQCPPRATACPSEVKPTVCTAKGYGGSNLPAGQVLKASGTNACTAELALKHLACQKNLDPTALGQVDCTREPDGDAAKLRATGSAPGASQG